MDEDAWEYIDCMLNRVISFGKPIEELAALLKCGSHGMDGLCQWLDLCINNFNISESLLEGKIQRVLNAIDYR